MSTELEWSSPENDPEASPPQANRPANKRWPWILVALFAFCGVALVFLNWYSRPADEKLLRAVELYVQAEKRAVAAGDDAIFFSMQADDPAWRASQIKLARDLGQVDTVEVIDLDEHGDQIWATLRFMHDGSPIQRQAFFQWDSARLLHVASDPDFWGSMEIQPYSWGRLQLHRSDREWGEMVGEFVATKVETLCRDGCIEDHLRFNLTLGSDYNATTAPGQVRVPSPHLIGLDGVGKPSPLFWKRLSNDLDAYLRPAEIRFATPDIIAPRLQSIAIDFAEQYPDIRVEVIPFSQLPNESDQMLQRVDGAYLRPTPSLIASDHVYDLTPLAESDPDVALDDFYATMLAASRWRGRLWALPLSAETRLVYYDEPSFDVATLSPESYLSQIWLHTLRGEADPLKVLRTESDGWGFLDAGADGLYAYAFAQRCATAAVQPCVEPLREEDLAAALNWYYAHVIQDGNMPDLTSMDDGERAFSVLNWLSIPRDVPMWVDSPAFHEHTNQLGGTGVLSLQAAIENGATAGPTPLQVHSGVISRTSENPVAVWTWLNYLSRQRPVGPVRSIPARLSVAERIRYWETLPPDLWEPMAAAFSEARAVGIAEEPYFGWEALADLIDEEANVDEIAARMMETRWFEFD